MLNGKKMTQVAILLLTSLSAALAQDPGWPREVSRKDETLVNYQPSVDTWNSFQTLEARIAISPTPTGGKTAGSTAPAEGSRSRAETQGGQGIEQEFQNWLRGATQTERFQQPQRSGGLRGGGGRAVRR